MPTLDPLAWGQYFYNRSHANLPGTDYALYRMTDLMTRGALDTNLARAVLHDSLLMDMVWEVTWADDDGLPDLDLPHRFHDCDGYVIFMHGWTGNHAIWEDMPAIIVRANPRLIAISVDHNGFGESRFVVETPELGQCCPPSAMAAVERLVGVLGIRRQPGETQRKVVNFVGHSMGGAALFYLNPTHYDVGEETRYAIAPALLLNDTSHRIFFNAMGLGIGIVDKLRIFAPIEEIVQPRMVEAVCEGSSTFVKDTHNRQYNETPRGTTSATFRAMGLLQNWEIAHRWDLFRVMLGHKDSLVGLNPMIDMLSDMEVPAGHIRVVAGSHYMFSVGRDTVFQHAQNRDLAVQEILTLHEQALDMQKSGKGSRGFG